VAGDEIIAKIVKVAGCHCVECCFDDPEDIWKCYCPEELDCGYADIFKIALENKNDL
jgi:hypothetical protein